jgi:peptide/nickel transport system substrate-binding protein
MNRSLRTLVLCAFAALALFVAGCGGDDKAADSGSKDTGGAAKKAPVEGAKKGGTLTVISNGDFIDIDCGKAYYQYDYQLCYATQRPLYSYKPGDQENVQPDLAAGPPEIAEDGKSLTIKIKPNIKFSPPLNRAVTSKDVKYAIERMFFETVNTGYAAPYLGDIVGAKPQAKAGTKLEGLETPDDQTLVIKLSKPSAAVVYGALSLPGSAPVPEELAAKHDAKNPSTYRLYQVATGPYMIEQDESGKAVGYKAGKSMNVVRNPSWDAKTDIKPAPLDGFKFEAGNDPAVAAKQIYQGQGKVSGDFAPLPPDIKLGLSKYKDQIVLNKGGTFRYVAMNTSKKPFDNPDIRRAVIAAYDRTAMRKSRGGEAIGDIASHFLPSGIPGFEEAGGDAGPDLDYIKNPDGDMAVAEKYMKAAGFDSGKYDGP